MRRLLAALLAFAFFAGASLAEDPGPPTPHPALWRVTGKNCTVYLLGSVHILTPTLVWRDERIDKAVHDADTFYFETALDMPAVQKYIADKGTLPPGESLRAMLPPDSQKDLDDDIATLGVPEAAIDGRRPWLATIAMTGIKLFKSGTTPSAGVDVSIMADAKALGKPLRYFETIDQQMALLAPDDPKAELKAFEQFLKSFRKDDSEPGPMFDAWVTGDDDKLASLLMKGFDKHPDARKAMLDDRNKAWVKTLEGVLDGESGTFLVTVGAGHLLTERGVPALLRKDGYKVERV